MPTRIRRLMIAFVVAAVSAALATQSANAQSAAAQSANAQSAAALRKIPAGVYEIVPDSNYSAGMDLSNFTMRFDGDSLMSVEQGGTMMSRARTSYAGELILWTDFEGDLMCPGTAKYRIAFDATATVLRLTPVEDPCDQRSLVVSQVHLVRKG